MAEHVQAVVIGGGPAGALSAAMLARRGWSVALIERGPRLRRKSCGHCLSARGLASLWRLGLESRLQRVAGHALDMFSISLPGEPETVWHLASRPLGSIGCIVSRPEFDQCLRDFAAECGAIVLESAAAKVVELHHDGARVTFSQGHHRGALTCNLLVGADGLGSAVARSARLSERHDRRRSFGFSFNGEALVDCESCRRGCVRMFVTPHGYLGLVQQAPGQWHVGAFVRGSAQLTPNDFLNHVAGLYPSLSKVGGIRAESQAGFCATGPMPWRTTRPARGRVLLVGDAAGYVEPFTGEGMSWAVESAAALDDVLKAASPGRWNESFSDAYCAWWTDRVGRRQRLCQLVSAALPRPQLLAWILWLGTRVPKVAERIILRALAA